MSDDRLRAAERSLDESDPASVLAYLHELRRTHGDRLPCPSCGKRTTAWEPAAFVPAPCAFCGSAYHPQAHLRAIERLERQRDPQP